MAKRKKPKTFFTASVCAYPPFLKPEFVRQVRKLERQLKSEVWLVIQQGTRMPCDRIAFDLFDRFVANKDKLPNAPSGTQKTPPIALLLQSGGGEAEPAYRIAKLLHRKCGTFSAVVPRYAKSAATLLALGAETIYLGGNAELGPLDAQVFDADDAEDWVSALDEVQAVEALEQSAIDVAYKLMVYLQERTGKRYNTLLPHSLHFAAEITKPLFEKIDAVRYSRQSRRLQEAQDYAERILRPKRTEAEARAIARDLVKNYPTHGFVIDRDEARRVGRIENRAASGLQIAKVSQTVDELLDWFYPRLGSFTAIGRITEVRGTL